MNFVVSSIENLPMSIVKGLYINNLEFVCLIEAFLLLMIVVEHNKKKLFFGLLSMLLIFSVSQLTRAAIQRNQMSFTVYSMNKASAFVFICGNEHVLLCDTTVMNDPSLASFSIDNNLIKEGVFSNGLSLLLDEGEFENMYMKKRGNLISFGGKSIGIWDEKSTLGVKLAYRPHLDYFIVHGRNKVDLERLLNSYIIDLLIIDGSVPDYLAQKIIKEAEEMGQDYYNVKDDGAFILRL